ncbi:MAG TPA: Uma2 family endonuclease [Blastocatellia bacterium]|nr:Uma2 family endonuclease [Blastocatellia bacterium]
MSTMTRWTSADLETMPEDGTRYEIIDGELYMSKQPHANHQDVCAEILGELREWNKEKRLGRAYFAPGLIFAEDDDVAPDVIWISNNQMATALWDDGKFHDAPEVVVEVLSPGSANERRDREAKLQLYSRRGVSEYWIVDWRLRSIDVYRRDQAQLHYVATLFESDSLESPLLPGFSCTVGALFQHIPSKE